MGKINLSLASTYKLEIASVLEIGNCVYLLSNFWYYNQTQTHTISMHAGTVSEFICVLVMLYLKDLVLVVSPIPSGAHTPFVPHLQRLLSSDLTYIPFGIYWVKVSPSLHIIYFQVFIYFHRLQEHNCSLTKTFIYSYRRIIRSHLPYFISRRMF